MISLESPEKLPKNKLLNVISLKDEVLKLYSEREKWQESQIKKEMREAERDNETERERERISKIRNSKIRKE